MKENKIESLINSLFEEFKKLFSQKKTKQEEKVEIPEAKEEVMKFKRLDTPFKLSKTGAKRLSQCCEDIQNVVNEVLYYRDVSVLCGYRSNEEQNDMYKKGTSKAKAGQSAHNFNPSLAIDIVPYPIPMKGNEWDSDAKDWNELNELIMYIAQDKDVKLSWGGNWKSLVDKPHYEIENWKDLVKNG